MPKSWFVAAAGAAVLVLVSSVTFAAAHTYVRNGADRNRIRVGRAIAPVPLDLAGASREKRERALLGSYLANVLGGCSDCHTAPPYAPGGDPFLGEPEQINTDGYLCGGQQFGPDLFSPDISPDANGLPAGLTLRQFIRLMRTGREANGDLLQVMPWPPFGKMTHGDLAAIYTYLTVIPSCSDRP